MIVREPCGPAEPFAPPRAFLEFRLLRPLGKGEMGEVYLAEDDLLGRQVAIKFLRHKEQPEMRARFLLEARALARLQHPNVVSVHRVGEVLGQPFMVAEWVDGKSLSELALPLRPELVLRIALQLARALSAVHRVGVLHRDLKPANVLLSDSGELKLVDFGVSASLPGEAALGAQPAQARPLAQTQPTQPVLETAPPQARAPGQTLPLTQAFRLGQGRALAETQPLHGAPAQDGYAPPAQDAHARPALQVGTPLYAAPELLSGAQASRQSDLYGWGAVVYEVCSGRPPHAATSLEELREQATAGAVAPLEGVPAALAQLVARCLAPDPAARPGRAEALLETLEPLMHASAAAPLPAEPYRGLSVFGPEHAALFFGRERDVRAVLERLRAATFVLVAGDSGVGKSSLCRAGVLPQLEAGALERGRHFHVLELALGTRPVEALSAGLARWLAVEERAIVAALRAVPEELAARVRAAPEHEGRALFLDGLEELSSLASPEDAECLSHFLAALSVRSPGFRLLATARSDYLTRLSALPSLGPEIGPALHLLRPLSDDGLRQAIEGPARAAGYRFEPESLVEELIAAARSGPGALPLVQFALVELWRKRNTASRLIEGEALAAIGGVGGALARHADEAVLALPGPERRAAEQILRRLVSAQGTRTRRTREELPPGDEASRALAALTAARLLTSRDPPEGHAAATYELAHEALLVGWDQLRSWVGQDAEKRALVQRVERAAEEWERLGSGTDGLWPRRLLRDLEPFGELSQGAREERFLAASRAGARRRRFLQLTALLALPLAAALMTLFARSRAHAALRERAAAQLAAAGAALDRARALDGEEAALQREVFAQFDAGDVRAEAGWTRDRGLRAMLEQQLVAAQGFIETALLLAPGDEPRELLARLLELRLAREHGNPLSHERETLLAKLAPLDPKGTRRAQFEEPARLSLELHPAGTRATLRSADGAAPVELAAQEQRLKAGSWVIEFSTGSRLPLLLRHGERVHLALALPAATPRGFIHVPAGRFLTGYDGDEDLRTGFFGAQPLHERDSQAFDIARTEATFGDWLDYLRALPAGERERRLPRAETLRNGLSLTLRPDGRFLLVIKPTTTSYQALEGEPLVYPGRHRNAANDWRRFPVTGISFEDARAYAGWLAQTGRVPFARLCAEEEWERAARGADGRSFPSGDSLAGDQANLDETYGREPLSFGPDPVGSHPASDSPIGAADLAGNAFEMTVSRAGTPILRGGSWYQGALTARSVNREPYEPTARDLLIGFRLCATAP